MAEQVIDLLGSTTDPQIRAAVWREAEGFCLNCRQPMLTEPGHDRSMHVDHVIPRYHGGQDRLSNYQALCRVCNLGKGATYVDYRAETVSTEQWDALIGKPVIYDGGTGMCIRWSRDFADQILVKAESNGDNVWLTLGKNQMRAA